MNKRNTYVCHSGKKDFPSIFSKKFLGENQNRFIRPRNFNVAKKHEKKTRYKVNIKQLNNNQSKFKTCLQNNDKKIIYPH